MVDCTVLEQCLLRHNAVYDILLQMAWEVEFSDEFGEWWNGLDAVEQKSVDFSVTLLSAAGPTLKMPHSSGVESSRHKHMRELRIQHEGRRTESFMRSIRGARQSC